MQRTRPSMAIGFLIPVLTICAFVLPDAAHMLEHRHHGEHQGAVVVHEHDRAQTLLTDGDTEHEHIEIVATATQVRPDVNLLPTTQIAVLPVSELLAPHRSWITNRHIAPPARTHDPPSGSRAPPIR